MFNLNNILNQFAKSVVREAKRNLTRSKKNSSRKLHKSLEFTLKSEPISLSFFMENYGLFQDQGVKGVKGGKSLSNFSFKPSSNLIGMELATGTFANWAKRSGLRYRDEKGRFKKGGLKSLGIAIAQSIKNKGIKPSLFFTKAFEKYFEQLPDDIVEAYDLQLDEFFGITTQNILNT